MMFNDGVRVPTYFVEITLIIDSFGMLLVYQVLIPATCFS